VYTFTTDWFAQTAQANWAKLLPDIRPARVLEIGSFEGASTCFLIDTLASSHALEIHCIDTWGGGIEHQAGGTAPSDMRAVESRFRRNTEHALSMAVHPVTLQVHKDLSHRALAGLLSDGRENYFDFVYVDGSHQAPDVLCDAVLAFKLLKVGGTLAFDDYLWTHELTSTVDILRCPKPAIDAFVNIYYQKLRVLKMPLYQLYLQKLAD
jgi:predicted O-methyltransferase YrrM